MDHNHNSIICDIWYQVAGIHIMALSNFKLHRHAFRMPCRPQSESPMASGGVTYLKAVLVLLWSHTGMFVDEAWRGQGKSKSTSWSTKWTPSGPNLVPYANMECLLTLRSGMPSSLFVLRVWSFKFKLQLPCLLWLCGGASLLSGFSSSPLRRDLAFVRWVEDHQQPWQQPSYNTFRFAPI